jgi:uncharacterized protein (DUF885 family)
MKKAFLFCVLVLMTMNAFAQPSNDYTKLLDQFFDRYFEFNPSAGTATGFHQYDTKLEDYSQAGIDKQVAFGHEFLKKFDRLDASKMSMEDRDDLELVKSSIHSGLFELEAIRQWQRNPDRYSSGITNSVFVIMSRNFASQPDRLKSIVAREKQMPAVFAAARANLKDCPKIYTEVAIEQIPGIVGFFERDVPAAFKGVKDEKLLAEFKETNDRLIAELKSYGDYLQKTVLPASNGDYRIGAANYQKKLLYDEMVDVPLDRLLQIGTADMQRNQAEFKRVAALIDAKATPQQILELAESDHPTATELIPSFRNVLAGLRSFIETDRIVTIPSPVPPIVEETPAFMRALTSASMDTPGPYEHVAKEAYFNVTLPEKNWPAKKTEEWLQGFNHGVITSTAIHEAYPGHYTQFLWLHDVHSRVRKLLGCGTNAEGWAHYTEQMMLDEGYGRDKSLPEEKDTKFLRLRLGQLQDALLRNARFIVGLKMHTGQMTFEQAADFFVKEGYQTPAVAERETKRGTSDPTYLMYTLGKLQIMQLREDYKKKLGPKFSLQEFHDEFMKKGFPPVKIIRREMLGNDSPTL